MVYTMRQGERAQFLVCNGRQLLTHSLGTNQPSLPVGAEVMFTIHLHSFHRGRELWELSDQERLGIAKRHRDQGSLLFKSGHFRGASMHYSKAVQCLAVVDPDTPLEVENLEEFEKETIALRTIAFMNLSACQLKFQQYDHVVQNCSRVLEVDPGNIKSWYRKAKALLGMKDFEAARAGALRARELDPSNQAVNELLKTVDSQEATHRAQYKDALRAMFD